MYIFTESIPISINETDEEFIMNCYDVINSIVSDMEDFKCDEMMSLENGDVVTISEFRRMLGILSSMPFMNVMYSSKNNDKGF